MRNKTQYGVFNLKWLVNHVILTPKAVEMVIFLASKLWLLLSYWKPHTKGFAKTTIKTIPWKEHNLEKWLRASCQCQILWISDATKVIIWVAKNIWDIREILKVKIEGNEHLSSNTTWVHKNPNTTNLEAARIQVSVKAFVLKHSHYGFIKLINNETNTSYTLWWNEINAYVRWSASAK